jgi:hypothetical protein
MQLGEMAKRTPEVILASIGKLENPNTTEAIMNMLGAGWILAQLPLAWRKGVSGLRKGIPEHP